MLGGPIKVIGKRILAARAAKHIKGASLGSTHITEMFATGDAARSEPNISSAILANITGTGVEKVSIPSEKTPSDLTISGINIDSLTDPKRGLPIATRLALDIAYRYRQSAVLPNHERLIATSITPDRSLADINIAALNYIRNLIKLPTFHPPVKDPKGLSNINQKAEWIQITDEVLDTLIALHGGLEFILKLWPAYRVRSNAYIAEYPDVMQPLAEDTAPFWLIDTATNRRLRVKLTPESNALQILNLKGEVVEDSIGLSSLVTLLEAGKYQVTFNALARVLLYSEIYDGHITGGGSKYNTIAQRAAGDLHFPMFPLIHNPASLVSYKSVATASQGSEKLVEAVRGNQLAAIDMILSVYEVTLRDKVRTLITTPFTAIDPQAPQIVIKS